MSSTKKISLVPPIYQILVIDGLDHFTVRELRDVYLRYLGVPVTSYTAREAYRVVYRQLATLQRHHFVIKTNAQDGVFKYQKNSKFSETAIVAKSSSRQRVMHIERISITTGTAIQSAHSYDGDLIAALRHTAYQYQADLLAAIGESEEYQRLAKDHPTLKNLFESDQREAADKRAKLSGQLRAIETVIMQHARAL